MTVVTYGLVVLSTVTHAYWNFVLKRTGGGQVFVGWSKVCEIALFAPLFLVWSGREAWEHAGSLVPLAVVGAALTLLNYALLAAAYRHAELSVVYPISRGGILLFLPLLGGIFLGERLDTWGAVAIATVVVGIGLLQLPAFSRAGAATLWG